MEQQPGPRHNLVLRRTLAPGTLHRHAHDNTARPDGQQLLLSREHRARRPTRLATPFPFLRRRTRTRNTHEPRSAPSHLHILGSGLLPDRRVRALLAGENGPARPGRHAGAGTPPLRLIRDPDQNPRPLPRHYILAQPGGRERAQAPRDQNSRGGRRRADSRPGGAGVYPGSGAGTGGRHEWVVGVGDEGGDVRG